MNSKIIKISIKSMNKLNFLKIVLNYKKKEKNKVKRINLSSWFFSFES